MTRNPPRPVSADAGTHALHCPRMPNHMGHRWRYDTTPIRHPEPRLASNVNERRRVRSGRLGHFVRQRKTTERIAMLRGVLLGAVAGAAGNLTLEIVTYGDMLLRGRAASGVPAKMARHPGRRFRYRGAGECDDRQPGGQPPERRRRPARVRIGGWARWRLRSRTPDPRAGVDAASWRRGWPRGDDRGRCVLCRNRRL